MTLSLNDSDLFRQHAFVGGEWKVSGSGKTMIVDNPSTGETIGSIPACTADETRSAIESARVAQIAWRRSSAAERSALLMGWYQLMLDNLDDLATIMTLEQGKPLAEARGRLPMLPPSSNGSRQKLSICREVRWFPRQIGGSLF